MTLMPWLLEAPGDFKDRCQQLVDCDDQLAAVRALANSALDLNQCHRLVRTIDRSEALKSCLQQGMSNVRLGLVSNGTMDLFVPALVCGALRYGIFLEIIAGDFGQAAQEALNPQSRINQARPDAVLIALDYRAYPLSQNSWAKAAEGAGSERSLDFLDEIRAGFRRHAGCPCIVQNLAPPPNSLLGSLDCQLDASLRRQVVDFNRALEDRVYSDTDLLLDVAGLAARVGTERWFDERQWLASRTALSGDCIPLYCDHVARLLAALRGKTRKCLVLDLDNTLWGGVIGDDGLEGITVGEGNALGEAFLALQRYAAELKSCGIILAVCSKNDEAIALSALNEHPDMHLRGDDFAVIVANWNDKASNLRTIAEALNIGVDSLVFVDDNPAEREIVRQLLPEVAVPELPSDPGMVPRVLASAGYFEMTSLTADDIARSEQYKANAERRMAEESASDVGAFLTSLEMTMIAGPFDAVGRKRIAQLINKTNQFNLTTRRYTEAEVAEMERSGDHFTLQVRLSDRFGDNGIISVVICQRQDECWEIDTWLMSCRVIKRQAEYAVCNILVEEAKRAGAKTIRGVFRPTGRNALVQDHFSDMGFSPDPTRGHREDEQHWILDVANYTPHTPPIQLEYRRQEVAEGVV